MKKFIIAGPGAGKTTKMLSLVNQLVSVNVDPKKIHLLSFSRNTANDISSRLWEEGIPFQGKTLHSLCYQIFLDFSEEEYQLIDNKKQTQIIEAVAKKHFSSEKLKNEFTLQKDIHKNELFKPAIKDYLQILERSKFLTFDQMITRAFEILSNRTILEKYFKDSVFLIDEGQDINPITEWPIYSLIASVVTDIYIFGSPSQEIYNFRGSNWFSLNKLLIEDGFIFESMNHNYRSTRSIVECGKAVGGEDVKNMQFTFDNENPVIWKISKTKAEQFETFLEDLTNTENNQTSMVLTRTNSQLNEVENYLKENGVNYKNLNNKNNYTTKEDLYFLDLFKNPKKQNLVNLLFAADRSEEIQEIVGLYNKKITFDNLELIIDNLELYSNDTKFQFENLYKSIRELINQNFDQFILINNYFKSIKNLNPKKIHNYKNIYNKRVAYNNNTAESNIILTTMHGSKGLEADNVFILSVNKGIFPHPKSTLKYEKNLFFVAITRAKLNLFIYSNKEKQIGGFQIPCKTIEL